MSQIVFSVIVLVAFVIFGVVKLTGYRVRLEHIFKAILIVLVGPKVVLGFLSILPLMIWASLVGWLEDAIWRKVTRRGREEAHQARLIKKEIHKKAEEYRKERLERGLPAKLPAKITHAEWEEVAAKRLVYGPWGDDGQSCFLPQRDEPSPQA